MWIELQSTRLSKRGFSSGVAYVSAMRNPSNEVKMNFTKKNHMGLLSLITLILMFAVIICPVSATTNENDFDTNLPVVVSTPIPSVAPDSENRIEDSENDKIRLKDVIRYLYYWNGKMKWGLSDENINTYSSSLEQFLADSFSKDENGYYVIDNYSSIQTALKNILNLDIDEYELFVKTNSEQNKLDRINYHNSVQVQSATNVPLLRTISADSQSAPYAYGNVYYLYIFVNFATSTDGDWTNAHRNDALSDIYYGTLNIKNQAPTQANMVNNGGYVTVTVTGSNPGDASGSWGSTGWMERAARQLTTDINGNGRYTDDLAESYKTSQNANSVMLVFFTHDDKGAYALGPDKGYADKCAVSYWGLYADGSRFDASINSYEHEVLHLYGALDEYTIAPTYRIQSDLAVSPMHEMYINENHESEPNHQHSIMCDQMYSYTTISLSTKRFIGWGDKDNDGLIDVIDSTPWG